MILYNMLLTSAQTDIYLLEIQSSLSTDFLIIIISFLLIIVHHYRSAPQTQLLIHFTYVISDLTGSLKALYHKKSGSWRGEVKNGKRDFRGRSLDTF